MRNLGLLIRPQKFPPPATFSSSEHGFDLGAKVQNKKGFFLKKKSQEVNLQGEINHSSPAF